MTLNDVLQDLDLMQVLGRLLAPPSKAQSSAPPAAPPDAAEVPPHAGERGAPLLRA
jgi:hypothetical protein